MLKLTVNHFLSLLLFLTPFYPKIGHGPRPVHARWEQNEPSITDYDSADSLNHNRALSSKPPFDKRNPNNAMMSSTGLETPRYTGYRKVIAAYDKDIGISDDELGELKRRVPGLVAVKPMPHTRTLIGYCTTFQAQEGAIQALYGLPAVRVATMDVQLNAVGKTDPSFMSMSRDAEATQKLNQILHGLPVKVKKEKLRTDGRVLQTDGSDDEGPQKFPDDEHWGRQWGMHQSSDVDIDLPEAWAIYDAEMTEPQSENVIVAVIDSGVDYDHPDLKDHMWYNPDEIPGDGIDNDNNGYVDDIHGIDTVNDDGDPMDDNDHGTHCAGVVAATAGNGMGIAGVAGFAPNVKIMAIKFLDDGGGGRMADAIEGMEYAGEYAIEKGAKISSNSWGGGSAGYSTWQAFMNVLASAQEADHLFIGAAGNDNENIDGTTSIPCSFPTDNVMCVASHTSSGSRSGFSNYGVEMVDVAAPGSSIYSTVPDNRYSSKSGTSMATPAVSGMAALLKSFRPNLSYEQLRQLIEWNVDQMPSFSNATATGGAINVRKAMLQADRQFIPPNPPTSELTRFEFNDQDARVGVIGGQFTVKVDSVDPKAGPRDATEVQFYFLEEDLRVIQPKINVMNHTVDYGWDRYECIAPNFESSCGMMPFNVSMPPFGVSVPKDARFIAAYPANATGIAWKKGMHFSLVDHGIPSQFAMMPWMSIPDEDTRISAQISFRGAASEADITSYNLYSVYDPNNSTAIPCPLPIAPIAPINPSYIQPVDPNCAMELEDVRFIRTIPAFGYGEPACAGVSCLDIRIERHGPMTSSFVIERSNYTDNERASITLKGPGHLHFTNFHTEQGYDWLRVGETMMTGDTIPEPITLSEGTHTMVWHTDGSVQKWGFRAIYDMRTEYAEDIMFEFDDAYVEAKKLAKTFVVIASAYNANEAPLTSSPRVFLWDNMRGGNVGGMPPRGEPTYVEFSDENGNYGMIHGSVRIRPSSESFANTRGARFMVKVIKVHRPVAGGEHSMDVYVAPECAISMWPRPVLPGEDPME